MGIRYRFGQQEFVSLPVDSGSVIEVGDLVFYDTDVKPASAFTWDTDLATTQASFANSFLGIAYGASASGETDNISVDMSAVSVYEAAVASATYEFGSELSADKDTGNALQDKQLEECTSSVTRGIARAFERAGSATTLLNVKFCSAFNIAANSANSVLG